MIRVEHLPADIFGLSALARAGLSGGLRKQGVATRAQDLQPTSDTFDEQHHVQLSKWLEACATAHTPHIAVLESIRALALPTASCVVHEALPAILCGPLQQIVGTLQTIVLARRLSTTERPVIPVLWVLADEPASPDLSRSRIVNRSHDLQSVQLDQIDHGRAALRQIELQAKRHGTGALRAVLSQLFGDQQHIEEALEIFVPRAGESLPGALTRAMYELFGASGLVIIEPEIFREELARACAVCLDQRVTPALLTAADQLQNRFGLALERDQPWLFRQDPRGRQALHTGGDGFRFDGEPGSRSLAELVAEIVQTPRDWQAGEWLLPAARAAVLPVLAEVGGERELVRSLLLHDIREARGWPRPAFVLRVHLSLVGAAQRTALERLGLTLGDVLGSRGQPDLGDERDEVRSLLARLAELKAGARAQLAAEKRALLELDPRLAAALRSASRDIGRALDQLRVKIEHLAGDQAGQLERHRRCLQNDLCPDGEPQETRLSAFSWVASQGQGWLAELAAELDPFCSEHVLLHLD